MTEAIYHDIRRYIGFTDEDADRLRAMGPAIAPQLPEVVDAFYERILRHPSTRQVLTDGESQVARLRASLTGWLEELFGGDYGIEYCRKRVQIGRTHVRVGLPQYLMITVMETVWAELERRLRPALVPQIDDKLRSLHKLLTIETALMLESYKESYSESIREGERAAVQDRLNEAEHLAHIGHLAASLAHEIKNPLAGISGAIQVLREPLAEDHPHRPILTEILRQIDRLDGTVKDLLIYSRPRPPRFQRCSLNRLIERVLTVLRSEPEMRRVKIEFLDSQKLDLFADEAQLEQLLINLLLNATQASGDGQTVRLYATSGADGLRLIVEDEGYGMDAEVARHAFEPFYTTKTKGTGLGLSSCRKIVDAHGGTITLHSVPNGGTTVTVRLPRFPPATTGGQVPDEYSRLSG